METDYLRNFLLVVEAGSMSEAARRLDLTPSAIAQQMRTLERELGVPLLARAGRTVQPTVAGYHLVERGQTLLREVNAIKELLTTDVQVGELRVGTINTAMHTMMPLLLTRFYKRHPAAKVFLISGITDTLYTAVADGSLDVAICLHPAFTLPKTFGWSLLRTESLVLLAPAHLAGADPHALLRSTPFVRYDRQLGGGKQADRYLRSANIVPQERLELSSLQAITMMVNMGLGVSLIPDIALPQLKNQRLVRIPLPQPTEARRFGILWLRASRQQRLIKDLVTSASAVVQATEGI